MTTPTATQVYVVRWVRIGNRPDIRQRYFTRRHDATAYADKLRSYGREPAIYTSPVHWEATR
jgi:predicted DNA-binding WGR domain protein